MSLDRWGEYEMSEVTPYSGIFPEHPGVKLDSFGLPLFNKEDIPGASVAIWDEWHQAALTEAVQRQPLILAEEMELRVERRKLHGCPDQPYILFFESDTVLIDREKKVGARKAPLWFNKGYKDISKRFRNIHKTKDCLPVSLLFYRQTFFLFF